jgi:anti-sigma regulatory factor (Ser/Thr protein kinase)
MFCSVLSHPQDDVVSGELQRHGPECLVLPMTDRAPALARLWAAGRLADLRWEGATDDVLLVVSELVTNAVRHAFRADGRVGVCLNAGPDGDALLRVTDPDPVRPEKTGGPAPEGSLPDEEQISGRGLPIVAALCASLTWTPLRNGGKAACARLRPAPAEPGPARKRTA